MFNVEFKKNNVPKKPGKYMCRGIHGGLISLINVVVSPASMRYGGYFDECLVDGSNGHNIAKFLVDWTDEMSIKESV